MDQELVSIRLARPEIEYLATADFLPSELRNIVRDATHGPEAGAVLAVSRVFAEQFRESFTERLAQVGFDSDYALTEEGSLLEGLIDRFFVR